MKIKLNPLDILVSEYVRRKAGGKCQRCGRVYSNWKDLQCCHYHGRRAKSTRYFEDNLVALCFGCHQHFHENKHEFDEFMLQRLGQDTFDMLEYRANRPDKPDIKLLTIYYKNEIKKLLEITMDGKSVV